MKAKRILLLKNASLQSGEVRDVLIEQGRISAIQESVLTTESMQVIDAAGGVLLPGLNDHHLHLAAAATARNSLLCGPPEITDADQLKARLRRKATQLPADSWIRGIGYHDSVAGNIDAAWLDACVDTHPLRVQHRGGRLWVFNSRGLECLKPEPGDPLERVAGRLTGRLYEGDAWLRQRMGSVFPGLSTISRELAAYGITGVTDTTPQNNLASLEHFADARQHSQLLQTIHVMGGAGLDAAPSPPAPGVTCGAHKFHLLESRLPDIDMVIKAIESSHEAGRNVAFHCVTRVELVFALAALLAAGSGAGDRIEHASVVPPELLDQIVGLGLTVVSQPAFVYERGDQYLQQVAAEDQPWLYRLRSLLDAGIPLAGSSDAPFASLDPWQAMHAAVNRRTRAGVTLGADEAVTPEQALALYTSPLAQPGRTVNNLLPGDVANLCLLTQPWHVVRANLQGARVCATFIRGQAITAKT